MKPTQESKLELVVFGGQKKKRVTILPEKKKHIQKTNPKWHTTQLTSNLPHAVTPWRSVPTKQDALLRGFYRLKWHPSDESGQMIGQNSPKPEFFGDFFRGFADSSKYCTNYTRRNFNGWNPKKVAIRRWISPSPRFHVSFLISRFRNDPSVFTWQHQQQIIWAMKMIIP